jgi:fumarate reductase subunit D
MRIGRLKFWTILSLPIIILSVGSIFIFGGIVGTQLFRGVITAISTVLGGVLFGVIFLTIAQGLEQHHHHHHHGGSSSMISQYLTMSAFGIILYLVTTTPPSHIIDWVHIPYPPFANVVWSFAAFAIYLYSFGFYFSTLTISQDTNLRKSVQKLAIDEANMLHNLGFEQMQREIQERVVKLTKEQEELLKEQTGIEQRISEEEMKEYVKEVMDKVRKSQNG